MTDDTTLRRPRDLRLGESIAVGGVMAMSSRVTDWATELSARLVASGGEQASLDSVSWKFSRSFEIPAAVRAEVVGRRFNSAGRSGEVDLLLEVVGAAATLATGECTLIYALDDEESGQFDGATPTFNSEVWVTSLVDDLTADERFAEATGSFDGSIALSFGATAIAMRIYRGRVIDRGRHLVTGATFGVGASPATWIDFARGPRNEFISYAMGDRFEIRGSTYDYLRMTSAMMVATDAVRRRLDEELSEHA